MGVKDRPATQQYLTSIMRVAEMDFNLIPTSKIMESLNLNRRQVNDRRIESTYKDELENLRMQHRTEMMRVPGVMELRREIGHGMSLAVRQLVRILEDEKAKDSDKIAAARLTAQIDGRFMGTDPDREAVDPATDSIASELIQAIKRTRETVQ